MMNSLCADTLLAWLDGIICVFGFGVRTITPNKWMGSDPKHSQLSRTSLTFVPYPRIQKWYPESLTFNPFTLPMAYLGVSHRTGSAEAEAVEVGSR